MGSESEIKLLKVGKGLISSASRTGSLDADKDFTDFKSERGYLVTVKDFTSFKGQMVATNMMKPMTFAALQLLKWPHLQCLKNCSSKSHSYC